MEEERSETVVSIPTSTMINARTEDISSPVRNEVGVDEIRILLKWFSFDDTIATINRRRSMCSFGDRDVQCT